MSQKDNRMHWYRAKPNRGGIQFIFATELSATFRRKVQIIDLRVCDIAFETLFSSDHCIPLCPGMIHAPKPLVTAFAQSKR